MFAKSKIRPCQRRGQLFAENEICATVQYQVSTCCNTPISDEISKNILVQKFDAFYLSNTAGIHNVAFFFSTIASQEKKVEVSTRTQTRRAVLAMKFQALFPNNGLKET